MRKRSDRDLIVGLDIGTSKVLALVGEVGADGAIEVLGIGTQPSRGLKKGVVVNIESTVQSIQRAVEEAELMAGCQIHSVYAGGMACAAGTVPIQSMPIASRKAERVFSRIGRFPVWGDLPRRKAT